MRARSALSLAPLALIFAAACGGADGDAPPHVATPASVDKPMGPPPCVAADLAKRARDFLGPASLATTLETREHRGSGEAVTRWSWSADRFATSTFFAGLPSGFGTDDKGPWALESSGVFVRQRADEIQGRDALVWLWRRAWLDELAKGKATLECTDEVRATFSAPGVGEVVLTLDPDTGAVQKLITESPNGNPVVYGFEEWSEPDATGARQPATWATVSPDGESLTIVTGKDARRPCPSAEDRASTACQAAPPAAFALTLPDTPVRVPMHFSSHELLVPAKVGADQTWALLDSGAGFTALDTTTARGAAFKPAVEAHAYAANEVIPAGFGSIPSVDFGAAHASSLPVLAVPIPILNQMTPTRPEIVLGFSFFEAATVRVDYAKSEITLVRPELATHAPDSLAIPFRIIEGRLVTSMELEGHVADVQIDTGNSGAFDVDSDWAARDRVFRDLPSVTMVTNEGAGTENTPHTFVRARHAKLGPLDIEAPLVDVAAEPMRSKSVGLVGNEVFSLCRAAVFDVPARTLWLEPPCKAQPEHSRFGWHLEPTLGAKGAIVGWHVAQVIPSSSSARAGLEPGDEIFQVGNVKVHEAQSDLDALGHSPPGTKLPVKIRRKGAMLTLIMTMDDLLPLAPVTNK